ncbi:MAG: tetratricopeptide repeat protein [Gemmatimonadota bacterium]
MARSRPPWNRPAAGLAMALAACAVSARPAASQGALGLWEARPGPLVADIRAGIDAAYDFDYGEALLRFDRVVAARPDHPVGYFLRAEAYWWQYLNDRRNARVERLLEQNLGLAIDRGKARLERDEGDAEALFVLGSAYGRRGMLAGTHKEAWQAASDARKAKKYLGRLREVAPDIVDAVAADGLYRYYVSRFGAVARTASRLLFGLKGSREEGLAYLDRARREGSYTRTEAAFFQGLFYLQFENRPAEAGKILDGLRARYPHNPYFATMAAYARQKQGQFPEARRLYEATLEQLSAGGVYGREGVSLTRYFYGQTLLALGDLAGAEREFRTVAGLGAVESDAFPHAHIFLGRIADLRGDRTAAETAYRQALALPDAADSHAVARRLLESPFTRGQLGSVVGGGK